MTSDAAPCRVGVGTQSGVRNVVIGSTTELMAWCALIASKLEPSGNPDESPLHSVVEDVVTLVWQEGDPPMALRRIEHTEVTSTNIKSAGYDEEGKILEVWFKSGGVYRYFDVPKKIFDNLLAAQSPGRYFLQNIRNEFQYRKIADRVQDAPVKKR